MIYLAQYSLSHYSTIWSRLEMTADSRGCLRAGIQLQGEYSDYFKPGRTRGISLVSLSFLCLSHPSGRSSLNFAVRPDPRKGGHYISAQKPIWTDHWQQKL